MDVYREGGGPPESPRREPRPSPRRIAWRGVPLEGVSRLTASLDDPKIIEQFKTGFSDPVVLWPLWAAITCPVLVLRGTNSDILTADCPGDVGAQARDCAGRVCRCRPRTDC